MASQMDWENHRCTEKVEEGMWAVLRRHLAAKKTVGGAAGAAGPCGLWKAPHVSQCCRWDCGVACAQMVLQGLGRDAERSSLLAALGTRSVWTIDLAMLLHRYGVRFMYCTRTVGVTEAYSTVDFYRSDFDRDTRRVQALFKAAEDAKVGAVQKAFAWRELAVLLSGYEYAAIVLVDSRFLYPPYPSSTPESTPDSPALRAAGADESPHAASSPSRRRPTSLPLCLPKSTSESSFLRNTQRDHDDNVALRDYARKGSDPVGVRTREDLAGVMERENRQMMSRKSGRRNPQTQAREEVQSTESDGRRECGEIWGGVAVDTQASARGDTLSSPVFAVNREFSGPGNVRSSSPLVARPHICQRKRLRPRPGSLPTDVRERSSSSSSSSSSSGQEDVSTPPRLPLSPLSVGRNCSARSNTHPSPPQAWLPSPPPMKTKVLSSPSLCRSLSSPKLSDAPAPVCAPISTATGTTYGSPRRASATPDRVAAAPSSSSSAYCGHYILLVGWSEADGVFIARDPSLPSSPTRTVSPEAVSAAIADGSNATSLAGAAGSNSHIGICLTPDALDRARRSYGTDEDVLVIDLARSRKGGVAAGPLAAAAAATALAASAASSAAAASALVGLFAMAAAAAAGAEASGFRESWGWPDPVAWLAKHGGMNSSDGSKRAGRHIAGVGGSGLPEGVPESAAKRIASLLSVAAGGLRFTTVGEAYNSRDHGRGEGGHRGGQNRERREGGAESASKRLASMLSLAASQLRFPTVNTTGEGGGDNRTATAMSREARAAAESAARRLASLLSIAASGFRFPSVGDSYRVPREGAMGSRDVDGGDASADRERERWADRVTHALEGLLEGGRWGSRRAAETMEGFLEGGRRAAYSLRDSLADVADAPGGAGAECGWGVTCACCGEIAGSSAAGDGAHAVPSSA